MGRRDRSALLQPASGDAAHREMLERPRKDCERLGMRTPVGSPLQHDDVDAGCPQLAGEPAADRPTAGDDDLVLGDARLAFRLLESPHACLSPANACGF